MYQMHKGDRVAVIKPDQRTTNEQRRQAMALIRSFPIRERNELTLQIGESCFQIVIDKVVGKTHNLA